MSQDDEKQASELAKQAFETMFDRELTRTEFLYLLSRYPFLELCDHENPYLDETKMPEVIIADNGWRIFDYGNAIFTSGCEWTNAEYRAQKQEETGEEGGGDGTLVKQYSDVAFLIIDLISKKGWNGIDFLTGYYPMLRIAWIAAEMKGLKVHHFEPSIEDYVVYNWVSKLKNGTFYPTDKPFLIPSKKPR